MVAEHCPQCGANLPLTSGEQIICEFCGSKLARYSPAEKTSRAAQKKHSVPAATRGLHLQATTCLDQQGTGLKAFHMLIPAGWEFSGGVQWQMNNPNTPAVIAFQVRSPSGEQAFEAFPNQSFYWNSHMMFATGFPTGSVYLGQEVRPSTNAIQTLSEIIIPKFRGQMSGLQISHQEHLPDLPRRMQAASPVPPDPTVTSDGARIRIHYQQNEQNIEEDLFGVIEIKRNAMPAFIDAAEEIFWMADYLHSFRAPAGQLDELGDLFQAIVCTFRLDPKWSTRYMQVGHYIAQNQIYQGYNREQIKQIIEQSEHLSGMMDGLLRPSTLDSHNRALIGTEAYLDPITQKTVELPGGYRFAWANGQDEYMVTDDPNFPQKNQSWQSMSHQHD